MNVRRHLRSPYTSHSLGEKKTKGDGGKRHQLLNNNNAEIKFKHTGQHLLRNQLQTYDIS